MADDTPELGRLVVLLVAIINHVMETQAIDRGDMQIAPILREADALVVRIAHRTRSAAGYDQTKRGQAALADAVQIVEQMSEGAHLEESKTGRYVELTDYVWSPEQLGGPIMPGMEPERKLVRRYYTGDQLAFLSAELHPPKEKK